MKEATSAVLFGIFVFVAVFGLPILLSHPDHHVGCPLQAVQTMMCNNTIIEHFSMWQSMFASIIAALILFAAVLLVVWHVDVALLVRESLRIRSRSHTLQRPTLMQELYSRGILNRKEPCLFS